MRGLDFFSGPRMALLFSPAHGRLSPAWRWDRNPALASRLALLPGGCRTMSHLVFLNTTKGTTT